MPRAQRSETSWAKPLEQAKRSQSRPTRLELARAKLARAVQKPSIIFLKLAWLVERGGSGRANCSQSFNSFWLLAEFNTRVQDTLDQVERDGSGRAELIFTFWPTFEVSDIVPDGDSTGRTRWAAATFVIFLNIIWGPITFTPFLLLPWLLNHPTLSIRDDTSLLQPKGGGAIMKPPPPLVLKAINRKEEDEAQHIRSPSFWVTLMYSS